MVTAAPDVDGGIATWLRTLDCVTAVSAKVRFRADPRDPMPVVVVRTVGAAPEPSDAAIFHRMVQIDVMDAERQRSRCASVANGIEAELQAIRGATALSPDVVAYGAEIQSVFYLPDPGSAAPRFSITVVVTARNKAAV